MYILHEKHLLIFDSLSGILGYGNNAVLHIENRCLNSKITHFLFVIDAPLSSSYKG